MQEELFLQLLMVRNVQINAKVETRPYLEGNKSNKWRLTQGLYTLVS